jgi:hypothetical protein
LKGGSGFQNTMVEAPHVIRSQSLSSKKKGFKTAGSSRIMTSTNPAVTQVRILGRFGWTFLSARHQNHSDRAKAEGSGEMR